MINKEHFYYRTIKDNPDSLNKKPEIIEEKKTEPEPLYSILAKEFPPQEDLKIEVPPPFEEITPPEPMGLPPPPPVLKKN